MPKPATEARLAILFRRLLAMLCANPPAVERVLAADRRLRRRAAASGVKLRRVLQFAGDAGRLITDEELARAVQLDFCRDEALDELLGYASRPEIHIWIKAQFKSRRLSYPRLASAYEVPQPLDRRDRETLFLSLAFDLATGAYERYAKNSLRGYDASRPFAPWYYTRLEFICRDIVRARLSSKAPTSPEGDDVDDVPDTSPEPDQSAQASELLDLIECLPDDQCLVAYDRIVLGLPPRVIAAQRGIPVKQVHRRIEAARQTLRGWLRPVVWQEASCTERGGKIHCDAKLEVCVSPGKNNTHRIALALPTAEGHRCASLHTDPLRRGENTRSFHVALQNGCAKLQRVLLIVLEMSTSTEEPMVDLADAREVSRETVVVQHFFGAA